MSDVADSTPQQLLGLHIAEYDALTERCTYWIYLEFFVASIFALYVGLAAQVWATMDHRLILWGSGVVTQILALVWAQILYEQYNATRYIERELRPRVAQLIRDTNFWHYESYLAAQRNGWAMWTEYSMQIGITVALSIIAFNRWPFSKYDWLGLIVNLALLVGLIINRLLKNGDGRVF